jgi:hypothetical protein
VKAGAYAQHALIGGIARPCVVRVPSSEKVRRPKSICKGIIADGWAGVIYHNGSLQRASHRYPRASRPQQRCKKVVEKVRNGMGR